MEFDAELKFAKIPNSYVEGGWAGGGGLQNLMLSSNLLKSKIPISMSPPLTLNMGILDFSKFELSIKFHKGPPPKKNGNFSSGLDLENLKLTFRNCFQVTE